MPPIDEGALSEMVQDQDGASRTAPASLNDACTTLQKER
jgi:hypothetical protein